MAKFRGNLPRKTETETFVVPVPRKLKSPVRETGNETSHTGRDLFHSSLHDTHGFVTKEFFLWSHTRRVMWEGARVNLR